MTISLSRSKPALCQSRYFLDNAGSADQRHQLTLLALAAGTLDVMQPLFQLLDLVFDAGFRFPDFACHGLTPFAGEKLV
jgi:hypothetical protein